MSSALPCDLSDFKAIQDARCAFADKSACIYRLVRGSTAPVFFSRPAGFGNTTLMSALDCLFSHGPYQQGFALLQQLLEEDCQALRQQGDVLAEEVLRRKFSPCKVLTFNFSRLCADSPELFVRSLFLQLQRTAESKNLVLPHCADVREIVQQFLLNAGRNNVAVLINYYDAPLLTNLDNEEALTKLSDYIRSFIEGICRFDYALRFVMVTGTGRFACNGQSILPQHFADLSHDSAFSSLLGLSMREVRNNFSLIFTRAAARLRGMSVYKLRDEDTTDLIQDTVSWYSGYNFCCDSPAEPVCAPADLIGYLNDPMAGLQSYVLSGRKIAPLLKKQLLRHSSGSWHISKEALLRPQELLNPDPGWLALHLGLGSIVPADISADSVRIELANRVLRQVRAEL